MHASQHLMGLPVGVVGAGAMGRGIAQVAALAGFEVRLFDQLPQAAVDAHEAIGAQLENLQAKGKLGAGEVRAALALIIPQGRLEGLAGCGLVIEAIVEQLGAKRELVRQLDALVGPDCIIASNTSSLSVTSIAVGSLHPERVAGLHFFNPVPLMKVAEVIAGVHTAEATAQRLLAFVERIGHQPVRAQDTPGFIVNHAGRGLLTEALQIVQEGVASFAQVDDIMREDAGLRLGPFELMDLVGLDVSYPVMDTIYRQYYQEPRYRPSVLAAQRLEAGLLGRKSGRGFYRYAQGKAVRDEADAAPGAQPWNGTVWLATEDAALRALLARCGAEVEQGGTPSAEALCLVAPLGEDVSTCVAALGLDARRTLGIDTLGGCSGRITLMRNPASEMALARAAQALLARSGQGVSLIADSRGLIHQRIAATIINIACDMTQQGICTPADLDSAVTLGLAYPQGPLAWGDRIGATRVLAILRGMHTGSGDPRYRPSAWLVRRAQLGLSLLHPEH